MKEDLRVIYTFVPFLISYHYNSQPRIQQEFTSLLTSTIFVYILFIYMNKIEPKMHHNPTDLAISLYVNYLSVYTNLMSLLIDDVQALLLLRYISWIFTFPYLLILDVHNHSSSEYQVEISIVMSTSVFLFNIAHHLCHDVYSLYGSAYVSVLFLIYYNFRTQLVKMPLHSYVNVMWIIYGLIFFAFKSEFITSSQLYICFTTLDTVTKGMLTYYCQITHMKRITNKYGLLKVVRMFFPMIEEAFSNNLISSQDYEEIKEHLDLSRDDISHFKNLIVDELFPDDAWKHMLSPFKVHKVYENMGVVFCDIVGYSTLVMNRPITESIQYIDAFYTKIDMIVHKCKVQKVETIGDAYLIVSENINALIECSRLILLEFREKVRIGLHCGETASCTLGISKLRHAYIGHAINVSARLESNGTPGKLLISSSIRQYLNDFSCNIISTQEIELKGIGPHETFLVEFDHT